MGDQLLQDAEQTFASRDIHDHEAELPHDLLQFCHDDPLLPGGDFFQEFEEPLNIVDREFNDHGQIVYSPPKDDLTGGPCCITFDNILQ
jgi:hypothetical protein